MDHVVLPAVNEGDFVFVLTADSMGASADGLCMANQKIVKMLLKNYMHFLAVHVQQQQVLYRKRLFSNGIWHVVAVHEQAVTACYEFHVLILGLIVIYVIHGV